MGKITVVCGIDRGDEGKGRISDLLGQDCSLFIKPNGSGNSGHTIRIGNETFKLHHIPAGVLSEGTKCLLSSGMVINPIVFMKEIDDLQKRNIDTSNIYVSGSAHINFPLYSIIDSLEEEERQISIGTTRRGNGVAYSMKYARKGMRFWDFVNLSKQAFCDNVTILYKKHLTDFSSVEIKNMVEDVYSALCRISPMIIDGRKTVRDAIQNKENILIETSQAFMLDIDEGNYPFVTSSCSTATTSCVGTGIGLKEIDNIVGVFKAYSTYVGNGVYTGEAENPDGDFIREKGNEYGTTTSRPRRTGWLEIPIIKNSIKVNSCTEIVLTKIDVLSGLDKVKIVKSYELDGKNIDYVPSNPSDYARCKPVYEEFDGWEEIPQSGLKFINDLPSNARKYIQNISDYIGHNINTVSYGPERNQFVSGYMIP